MNKSECIGVETRGRKRARELRDGEGEGDGKGEGEGGGEGEGDMIVVSTVRDVGSVTKGKPRRSKVSTREGAKTSAARCSKTRSPPPHLREGRRKGKQKPRGMRSKDARGVRPLEEQSGNEAARDVERWFEKSLRGAAAAKPTRVVSTSEGGRGYKCLVNESVEELQEWGDYDEKDDEQFFANGERLEQQRAEKAAAVTIRRGERRPAAKRARIDGDGTAREPRAGLVPPVGATAGKSSDDVERESAGAGARGGAGETMTTAAEQVKAQARGKSTLKTSASTLHGKRARQNASFSAGPAPKDMCAPDPAPEDMCAPCFPIENERRPCGKQRQCEFPNCPKRASFALSGQRARHCKPHAESDEVNVVSKRCEFPNCPKHPSFALSGQRARHCKTHAESDEVDVVSKRCEFPNCTTKPSFALSGQRARHCKTHAESDEVDVVNKRCEFPNCPKQPSFALSGQRARHCKTHAESDEVDVVNKRCEVPTCPKRASFALSGQPARHCKTHAESGEVIVTDKLCEFPNCTTRPSFALSGQPARHCKTHAESGEVYVVSKLCEFPNCTTKPSFALSGQPARHCKTHAESDEVDVISKRCEFPNCTKHPSFALPGQPARHCKTHAESGEVIVSNKRCQGCEEDIGVSTAANPSYAVVGNDQSVEHLCAACFHRKYPKGAFDGDKRVGGRIHSREGMCVNAVLNAEGLKDLEWTWDRPFWFGCWEGCDSKRRVDMWVLIGACVLGVEIDENQHRGKHYAADAEVRTNEIAMEIGLAPFYLVRFNPDSYVTKSDKKVKGFYEVKNHQTRRNKPEIDRRLATLIQTVEEKRNELEKLSHEKSTLVEAYLVETFLFFDGYAD